MTYDDDAAYQNAQAADDESRWLAEEQEGWTDEQWNAYEAERRAEYDAAMGPVVRAGDPDGLRDAMMDERDAWDESVPLAEFDPLPF